MRANLSLRSRIAVVLSLFVLLIMTGAWAIIWYTCQMDSLFIGFIDKDVGTLQAVGDLEKNLNELSQNNDILYIVVAAIVLKVTYRCYCVAHHTTS